MAVLELYENMEVEVNVENGHIILNERLPALEELADSLPPIARRNGQ